MYDFEYQRPASLNDALSALNGAEDGKLLAGGHTLLPTLKQRLARPSTRSGAATMIPTASS